MSYDIRMAAPQPPSTLKHEGEQQTNCADGQEWRFSSEGGLIFSLLAIECQNTAIQTDRQKDK